MTALLLSGGMDSISIAWWKRPSVAIFVDYGQVPAKAEEAAGRAAAEAIGIRYEVVRADCSALGSGDMAGKPAAAIAPVSEWWPFRNQLILTIAGTAALQLGETELMIGALRTDSQHVDGRAEFIDLISRLMSMQEGGLRVSAPAIALSADELVRQSGIPQSVLGWAHSCHKSNLACGQCRGCIKHYETWEAVGWDPH
ncbi:7-cyano-7-deazaguanine synthase [Phenylobacterium sp.]|uniref:7-cyano-7-deazaguanine synthase n=1 Tax=Phenylobacterium sp. TaxID=1871053 RepID=UPI002731D337|nr:7-cyano-7-deazaguanine synthase [Phenylobacterium sp.]MDP1616525.1 7-cyano-7-deazaguanine synthase [Phenylobacterium sp.]MDP1985933.1 7-cyano-7-deazaguanine synthase [Phenylobacterium sp.]